MRSYGPSSEDWLGKEIELRLGEVEFQKKMQDTVIIEPISPPLSAAAKAAAAAKLPDASAPSLVGEPSADPDDPIPF
jgi:hypothetical protein